MATRSRTREKSKFKPGHRVFPQSGVAFESPGGNRGGPQLLDPGIEPGTFRFSGERSTTELSELRWYKRSPKVCFFLVPKPRGHANLAYLEPKPKFNPSFPQPLVKKLGLNFGKSFAGKAISSKPFPNVSHRSF